MSGISSIGSTTPTTNQILEAELQTHLLHAHAQQPTSTSAAEGNLPAVNDPGSNGVSGVGNTSPTSQQVLEAGLRAHRLHTHAHHPASTVATQANQSADDANGTEINETA